MIILYDKETEKPVSIYKIRTDHHGYAECLVRRDGSWVWRSIKHYIPFEETTNYNYSFN